MPDKPTPARLLKNIKADKKRIRNTKIVVGVIVVGAAYVWHRRVLDHTIEALTALSQEAVEDTMWRSFDEGVKYGLTLEKTVNIVRDGKDYAFGAFDKASDAM